MGILKLDCVKCSDKAKYCEVKISHLFGFFYVFSIFNIILNHIVVWMHTTTTSELFS